MRLASGPATARINSWSTGSNWDAGVPLNNGTVTATFGGTNRLTPTATNNWDLLGITFLNTAGAFVLSGNTLNLRSGGVINNDGTLQTINNAITLGAAQSWNAASGNLQFGGAVANGGFLLTSTGSFATTISGVLSGSGGLTKSGTGTLTLNGTAANTFTGNTLVNSGTLILAKTAGVNALASTALTIGDSAGTAGSAIVQLNASNQIPGSTNVTIQADGQLNLQSFTDGIGALDIHGGSIIGTGRLDLGGNVTASPTGTNVSTIAANLSLNATRTFTVNSNSVSLDSDLTVSGVISNGSATSGLIKNGPGYMLLSGANTYTGTTEINDGIVIADSSSTGTSGALGLGSVQVGPTSGNAFAGLVIAPSIGRTITNAVTVRAGGTGLVILGGYTATGLNTFAGPVTLQRSAWLLAATGGEVSFTGGISGAGAGVTIFGGGTVRLGNTNSYTGPTVVDDGTLVLSGSISGTLTVDFGGRVSLEGAGNHIADTASLELAGGTLATQGFSETIGALRLSVSSTIDFGAGSSVLSFASGTFTAGTLTIAGWSGNGSGGGTDQLRFTSALSTSLLAAIQFQGYTPGARQILSGGSYAIVPAVMPVPEPSTFFLALLGGLALYSRKRLRRLSRPARR